MRFSSTFLWAAAACQAVAAGVPEHLFLGQQLRPRTLEFFGVIQILDTKDKQDPSNYHPEAKLVNGLYMSTSSLEQVAIGHMRKVFEDPETFPYRFVYKIKTKEIENSFLEVAALYAKQGKQVPHPDEHEWLATANIEKKHILGWYELLPDGRNKWVDREEWERQREAERLAKKVREKGRSGSGKARCALSRCAKKVATAVLGPGSLN
ncbi:hypothetical protein PspLS_01845 [Pyricularia sp. CBS 133598]|nr:hypothetical protein PspLS_01845 [Pyricularia sp. CBS 133598]